MFLPLTLNLFFPQLNSTELSGLILNITDSMMPSLTINHIVSQILQHYKILHHFILLLLLITYVILVQLCVFSCLIQFPDLLPRAEILSPNIIEKATSKYQALKYLLNKSTLPTANSPKSHIIVGKNPKFPLLFDWDRASKVCGIS